MFGRHIRGLVALGLAIGLVATACSSSSPLGGNGGNGGNGQKLASGLAANLDKLDSYKFAWHFSLAASGSSAADTGSMDTSGTVVNKGTKAYKVNDLGFLQIIAIGDQGWTSFDNGNSWTVDNTYSSTSSSLKDLLPVNLYGSDFDSNATQFSVVGDESKNGVQCVHYRGASNLGAAGAIVGVTANFSSDLWVAKDGNYPVSGFYGWSTSSGGQGGTWGYSFDVTDVNGADNVVTPPANVMATPSF